VTVETWIAVIGLLLAVCAIATIYGFVMIGNVINKGVDEILAELRRRK
jgi:hypothetical protein